MKAFITAFEINGERHEVLGKAVEFSDGDTVSIREGRLLISSVRTSPGCGVSIALEVSRSEPAF